MSSRRGPCRRGQCFQCGKSGHHAHECPTTKNPQASTKGGTRSGNRSSSSGRYSGAPRNQERRFFDKITKDASSEIRDTIEAERFLKAAMAFRQEEGAASLLYRLADPQTLQAGSLRKALEFIPNESVLVNGFLPLLEILGCDDLGKPVYEKPLEVVLENLYNMKFLIPELLTHTQASTGALKSNDSRTALIWFLTKLALKVSQVRSDTTVIQLGNHLSESGSGAECLQTVLAGNGIDVSGTILSLAEVRDQQAEIPGGRHDNDFADFRSISIIPTIEEFLCPADPYLPRATSEAMTAAQLLDRHFRLLRQDILGPAKDEQDDPRKRQRDMFEGVRASHVVTGEPVSVTKNDKSVRITGPSDPCICFSFRIPNWHRAHRLKTLSEKEEYWSQTRRILPRDALVCFQRKNADCEWVPIRFGTIVRREVKELAVVGKTKPVIGIAFFSQEHVLDSLKELAISDYSYLPPTRLVVVSAELFAYKPILRGLQMMDSVPFADEILRGQVPDDQAVEALTVPSSMLAKVEQLDDGQRDALNHALTNRVTLIQGPPGTGKTFIGVALAQIILASTNDIILCVCYTNHALDDFLEGLLDVGIHEIVRVGGRSKNKRLEEYNLIEKAKSGRAPFNREQTRRYAHLKQAVEETVGEVKNLQKVCRREIGKGWWKTVEPHLQQFHPDSWEQLRIDCLADEDGFKIVGVENDDHLWKLWIGGKAACPPFEDRNGLALWKLSKEERTLLKLEWQHEIYEEHRFSLDGALKTIKNAKDELKQLRDNTHSVILSQARIIACTTTKAAMCKHLLNDVSAGVVLVEEAAEIFESHVLTSLSKNTKRLIMIGDHKQLRPKAQHYPLTVESNRQLDLNRSLFERLAQVLPTSRLGIQHRMHPLISAVPRLTTYPELMDAPGTHDRPEVRGLQSRVIFVNHDVLEDTYAVPEDNQGARRERVDTVSKTNDYEVHMVVAIVKYLFQQGYEPQNMVVLTPYLGQLLKIQETLSSTWNVFVDEMDFNEARNFLQGVEGFALSKKGVADGSVRVATIDNYQGEEADIVVASLVRSNPEHTIGFLKEPERVNVLLSRARTCEIVIGSRKTLEGARGTLQPLRGGQLWREILGHLDSCGNVFDGLPVVCQSHGNKQVLGTANMIAACSPDGGCSEPCAKTLNCGHPCTKRCHVGPCIKCVVACPDKCPRGHSIVRKCSEDPPACHHTVSWKCPLGHALSGPCFKGKDSSHCSGCQILIEKENAQLRVEREMQEALDRKHDQLEARREKLQEALRDSLHKQQLDMIDEEMALVERQLEETQAKSSSDYIVSHQSEISDGSSFLSGLDGMVCSLLSAGASKTMLASQIAESYRARCGQDLQLDANQYMGKADGSTMGFREIFEALPCCEIVRPASLGKKKRRKQGLLIGLKEMQKAETSSSAGTITEDRDSRVHHRTIQYDMPDDCINPPIKKARIHGDHKQQHPSCGDPLPSNRNVDPDSSNALTGAKPSANSTDTDEDDQATTTDISETTAVVSDVGGNREGGPLPANGPGESSLSIRSVPKSCDLVDEIQGTKDFEIAMAVADVVKRYEEEGALAADNLLDEIKNETDELDYLFLSFDYVIQQELDPCGNHSRPPPKTDIDDSLCTAVCLYAYALYCSACEFPLQARQMAEKMLEIVNDDDLHFPKAWMERARELSRIPSTGVKVKEATKKKDSPSDKWSHILTNDRKAPAVIQDSVLPMIGLPTVKNSMIGMYHRIKLAREQNDGVAASYNIRFEGNPGTGKTTIAKYYGTFLQQLEVLPGSSTFKETSGAKLINDGISGLETILEDIKAAGGGIVFCDEAYQLVSDREGQKVLDFILPIAEKLDSEYGLLVWVFAGYKKEMEKLFELNAGLRSRFPHHFVFEDYSDDELRQIFEDMMKYQSKPSPSLRTTNAKRRARSTPSYQPSFAGSYSNGAKKKCRFRRAWTFYQYSGWTDDLGNRTVDPSRVGMPGSELVDPSGQFWEETDGEWFNVNTGETQRHYPGELAPTPTSSRTLRPNPFHCNDNDLQTFIRRLGRRRGDRGFGNARAVRDLFDCVRVRQATRVTEERDYGRSPDKFEFVRTDLLGPDITKDTLEKSDAWQQLENMEGLLPVKESVSQLFRLVLNNVERERKHRPLFEVALNRLFLGGPGTGKTTVAKLYGQILAELGLLSKGEVIYKCASDFVGDVLGASEKTTRAIIESAEGCVLVIDEAYALYSGGKSANGYNDPYKTAVIDTIVEQVQARPGADIAVVMLGYQAEMENMLAKVNPGLSRRFQLENAFHFPDFDDAALIRIMMAKAREADIGLELAVAKRAVRSLAKARAKPNFGNAGAVDNILSKATSRMQVRGNPGAFSIEDFEYSGDGHDENSLETLFDGLIGCKEVRKTMEELRNAVVFSKAQGRVAGNSIGFNYLFLGSPGTGKTTVARRMGIMFEALGLLPGCEMKEVKASDLLTGYVGQAGMKTRELLREARGGVLFIDEAYQLDPKRGGSFMTEAVDELVGALTEEEFKGKLLVILAGYDNDMEQMLSVNPGLKSRFSERVHFHDFDANATAELLQMELERKEIPLVVKDLNDLCRLAQRLVDSEGFGNGRDVVTWADRVFKQVAKRYSEKVPRKPSRRTSMPMTSSLEDATKALDLLLSSRIVPLDGPRCSSIELSTDLLPTLMDSTTANAAQPPAVATKQATEIVVEEEDEEDSDQKEIHENVFDDIDGRFLQSLQEFIDKEGLDTEDGVARLSLLDPCSVEFSNLLARLVDLTGMDPDTAREQLIKWQEAQKDLRKKIEATKSAIVGARPIWRCAVCGRANKPYIACYVAPYIVGYEQVEL